MLGKWRKKRDDPVDEGRVRFLQDRLHRHGDAAVVGELAGLLGATGRFGDLALAADRAARLGDGNALLLLDQLSAAQFGTAVQQLEEHAGDPRTAGALATVLHRRGLADRLLGGTASSDFFAVMRAADQLIENGHEDEAIEILIGQAARGGTLDWNAAEKAIRVMLDRGSVQNALGSLARLADLGEVRAAEWHDRLSHRA
ncbi:MULTISPECIES: hypothetical protein [Actinoplanes]|uniref:hypothetical protein n=1 Tax=Actinoplanes TaxID=1865 RepID=UPI0005F2CC19|nr:MULTISPECIES: hypothetical protein [Actinoplanes]GLY00634.1 hypothetical protein Acsp01_10130 [Actinoplanes sp. NBRC 101535]